MVVQHARRGSRGGAGVTPGLDRGRRWGSLHRSRAAGVPGGRATRALPKRAHGAGASARRGRRVTAGWPSATPGRGPVWAPSISEGRAVSCGRSGVYPARCARRCARWGVWRRDKWLRHGGGAGGRADVPASAEHVRPRPSRGRNVTLSLDAWPCAHGRGHTGGQAGSHTRDAGDGLPAARGLWSVGHPYVGVSQSGVVGVVPRLGGLQALGGRAGGFTERAGPGKRGCSGVALLHGQRRSDAG